MMYNDDRKKEKSDHHTMERVDVLEVTKEEIGIYLTEVKNAIRMGRYRIENNDRRQDNLDLIGGGQIVKVKEKRDFCTGCRRDVTYTL